jgi:hypothetical protein
MFHFSIHYEQAFISYYFFVKSFHLFMYQFGGGGEDNPDPEIHVIVQEGNSYRLDALYKISYRRA